MGMCHCSNSLYTEAEEKKKKKEKEEFFFEHPIQGSNFSIKNMRREHIEGAARVFCESCKEPTEPRLGTLSFNDEELGNYIIPYLKERVDENLSFVAVDNSTDEVVGLFFHEDFGYMLRGENIPDFLFKLIQRSFRWAVLSAYWEELEEFVVNQCKKMKITKVVHLVCSAVSKKAKNLRNEITEKVLDITRFIATERGYELMFAKSSSIFSEIPIKKCFQNACVCWTSIDYNKFEVTTVKGVQKPFYGCNDLVVNFLKKNNLYKEEYIDCARSCKLLAIDLRDLKIE